MPAIRFLHGPGQHELISPGTYTRTNRLRVRLINGKEELYSCEGFICEHGLKFLPEGAYAKVIAREVTVDDGDSGSTWLPVHDNQYVLGWRALHNHAGSVNWSVYIVVNEAGLPVVKTDKGYKSPPNKKAGVVFLDNKRPKTSHKIADKQA